MKTLCITTLICSLLLATPALAQTPDFSNAHRKLAKHFLGLAGQPIKQAFWLRHDALVLAIAPGDTKPKAMAKLACEQLNRYGFASQNVTVFITGANSLARNTLGEILAERACRNSA